MKQKVWLTTEPNAVDETVHVDDVIVKDGVYLRWNMGGLHYLLPVNSGFSYIAAINGERSSAKVYDDLKACVDDCPSNASLYTLSGTRIVTEKRLTVGDLKNTDHVGFVVEGERKGHIIGLPNNDMGTFIGIMYQDDAFSRPNICLGSKFHKSLKDVFNESPFEITEVTKFDTYQELHKWLSE